MFKDEEIYIKHKYNRETLDDALSYFFERNTENGSGLTLIRTGNLSFIVVVDSLSYESGMKKLMVVDLRGMDDEDRRNMFKVLLALGFGKVKQ